MSFSIKPSGSDPSRSDPSRRIDITTNTENLKNVKTYGNKIGKVAEKMGLAKTIKGEGDQLYYVSIRSLGKAWSLAKNESRPVRTKIMEKIKGCFEDRTNKAKDGKLLLMNEISLESHNNAEIAVFLGTEVFKQKGQLIKEVLDKLLYNKSNLTEVYEELKKTVKNADPKITATDWDLIFRNVNDLTDYGKFKVIDSFIKRIAEKTDPKPATSSSPVSKKEQIEVNKELATAKAERRSKMKAAVDAYFAKRDTIPPPEVTAKERVEMFKKYDESLSQGISKLLFNKSNLDEVTDRLCDKIDKLNDPNQGGGSIYDDKGNFIDYREITAVLKDLTPSEKLEFIEIFEAKITSNANLNSVNAETDYGRFTIIDSFIKRIPPEPAPDLPSSTSVSKNEQIEVNNELATAKAERRPQIKAAVDSYFAKKDTQQKPILTPRQHDNMMSEIMSELLPDKSNLDDISRRLCKKIAAMETRKGTGPIKDGNGDEINYKEITAVLNDLNDSEKLEFIEILKAKITSNGHLDLVNGEAD